MATVLDHFLLDEKKLQEIIQNTKEYALLHGILMRTAEMPTESDRVEYAQFALLPSLVPRHALDKVKVTQLQFSKLMHRVAHDQEFLVKCLSNVIKVDDFTKRLWDILQVVTEEGIAQPVSLGLFRNDFMMDVKMATPSDTSPPSIPDNIQMKQIEFNMIASSFAGLVSPLYNVHRYSLTQAGKKFEDSQVPENNPALGLAEGLVEAWKVYGNKRACVVFLVSAVERNALDQRRIDTNIFACDRTIPVVYLTLKDFTDRGRLAGDKILTIDHCEVAVIYFRTGYAPDDYRSDKDWDTRLMMERSKAIKCPSVQYQLAGTKKVQQELCRDGAVERFISDGQAVSDIRETFAYQYSLDMGKDGDATIERAFADPENYVLKPNREGGGNNIYGGDIKDFLAGIKDSEERVGYILMERIQPWPQKNYLLKVGEGTCLRDVVSEIGIYSVFIGTEDKELYNRTVGHLVRTKMLGTDEGGIIKGFSCLDTPFLIDF